MTTRTLDRLVEFDERSRNFSAVVGIEDRNFRSYTWSCDVYNDQGSEGACVGFGWTHELAARPKIVRRDADFALKIYRRAQELDGYDFESGTTVLAGVKAIKEVLNHDGRPLISEYRWAFGIEDVLRVIAYKGPVVLGINWYENMYYPDAKGFIHATGPVVGGHCILANGVKIYRLDNLLPATWDNIDLDKSWVRLHNSWGTGYGIGGDAFISVRDLDKLLKDDGEACIPTVRRYE